ncbi:galanin receptor type 1-like [Amblyraja radiata]|uniref:galanin receptor type 1-like n=1 Tax=Amblyraja radiata TaxID=386614 RepID=UPI0014033BD6|nr:galanin receptor type 1-like [Amblyraja radiata]
MSSSNLSASRENADLPLLGPGVVVPVIFGFIFLLGITGNTLVLVVLGRTKSKKARSTTNVFILNLSISSIAFLVFCVPFEATIYTLPDWIFGAFLCKTVHYFKMVTMLVSIFTMVAMSVDRYIAVVRSMRPPSIRTTRNATVGVGLTWLLSLLVAVPVAQQQNLLGHHGAPNNSFCWNSWHNKPQERVYKVGILVIGYLLPLLLICYCYAKILFHLHKKMRNVSKKSKRSKKKTAQTVMLVVATFLLSWLPQHIITMWAQFGTFPMTDASFAFRIISHCMVYGNSCINPIIYAFLSENFRKACHQAFVCKFLSPHPIEEKVVRIRMDNFSAAPTRTNT